MFVTIKSCTVLTSSSTFTFTKDDFKNHVSYKLIRDISIKHYTEPIFIHALFYHWRDEESALYVYVDVQPYAMLRNRERNSTGIFNVIIIRV
jgi:hypothetical protein